MTAIRDRKSDPDAAGDDAPTPWDERAAVGARRGLPWWGAVLLGFAAAVLGAIVDLQVSDALGVLFQVVYLVGSVAAVGAVRRRSLFGPMVQPPLVLAITVPVMVLLASGLPSSSDLLAKALAIGTPLINGFPMMAITTGLTVAIGVLRMYRERDPDAPRKEKSKDKRADDEPPADRKASGGRGGKSGKRKGAAEADPGHDGASVEPTVRSRPAGEARGEPPRRGAGGGAGGAGAKGAPPAAGGRRGRGADEPRRGRPPEREPGPREPGPRQPGPREAGPREPGQPGGGKPPRDQAGGPPRRRPPMPPDGAERRRRAEEWPDAIPEPKRPRRRPPNSEEPPPRRPSGPRRDPGRGDRPPRRGRPWDDDAG